MLNPSYLIKSRHDIYYFRYPLSIEAQGKSNRVSISLKTRCPREALRLAKVLEYHNFLGNETEIGNQAIIGFILGLFFVYFLYRYYLACREISGVKEFIKSTRDLADFKMSQKLNEKIIDEY